MIQLGSRGNFRLWSQLNSSGLRGAYSAGLSQNSLRAQAYPSRRLSAWKLDSVRGCRTRRVGNYSEQLRPLE
jgi:hypothetical protein